MRTLNFTDLRIRFTTGCLRASSALAFTVAVCAAAVCHGNLRQYWPFDDGAGTTATNAVTGGNNATLMDIDGWTNDVPAALADRSAGSLDFAGTNLARYVYAGHIGIAADGGAKGASLSVWLKPPAPLTADARLWNPVRTSYKAPHPGGPLASTIDSTGQGSLYGVYPSGSTGLVLPYGSYKADEWQHYCFVWENNHLVSYYNGEPLGGMSPHTFQMDLDPRSWKQMGLAIGARYAGRYGSPYDGKMDDFAVWDSALTPERVRQLASGASPLEIAPQGDITAPGPPLASYLMDGDALDAGGTYPGTLGTAATFADGAGDTPFAYAGNKAIQLDGTGYGIEIADAAALRPGTGAWTLSLWFKTSTGDQLASLFVKRTGSSYQQMNLLMGGTKGGSVGNGNRIHPIVIGTTGSYWWEVVSDREYADGTWHHVALVRNAGGWNPVLYIDGVPAPIDVAKTLAPPDAINNTVPWRIGGCSIFNLNFTGLIDEAAMWDEALTGEEIAWLAQNSLVSIAPPQAPALPLAAYRMNNNAKDSCEGRYHGTLAGNATFVTGAGNTPFPPAYTSAENHALQLDGGGSYVTIADSPELRPGTNAWTLSLWFKTTVGDGLSGLIAKKLQTSPNTQMALYMGGSAPGSVGAGDRLHPFVVGAQTVADRWEVSTRAGYADGAWHHAALVRPADGKNPVLYVDGVMAAVLVNVDAGQKPHDIDCGEPWIIGASSDAGALPFSGLIDEVAMWDTALRADEIAWLVENSIDTLFPAGGTLFTLR